MDQPHVGGFWKGKGWVEEEAGVSFVNYRVS